MIHKIKLTGIAVALLSLSSASFAVNSGMYFGLQVGQTNTHNKSTAVIIDDEGDTEIISPKNTGFGGRFSFGYNFNQYGAWEFGYTHYASSSYNVPNESGSNPSVHESSIEILAKGIYPFGQSGFSIYGKGGLGVMYAGTSASIQLSSGTNKQSFVSARPALGIGVGYDISQSWVVDFGITSILGGGTIQRADFIALGITYHIVDKYCGQFLC